MDDDPALRDLGAALERDDPRLAALLRAGPTVAGLRVLAGALVTALVLLASIRLGLAAFGVLGICLLVLSPMAACLWCATTEQLRPPEPPATR